LSADLQVAARRVDSEKAAAAQAAAALVEAGMIVGLGTGSTASLFVRALAARTLRIRCVATSKATAALALELGLTVLELDAAGRIDLTVDGADEIGPGLALIKGGGGALLREKLVWEASARCLAIADSAKCVTRLGAFPLPVEVTAFGHETTARRLAARIGELGYQARPTLRMAGSEPLRTDGGNLIYDLRCGAIADPAVLAGALKGLTGVVEHGLFLGLADQALIGGPAGVETRRA
jgi:ribose 5-phosphate isomerase A